MQYPLLFLQFWYLRAPLGIFAFFSSLNKSFLQLFSVGLLLRTFFKPWKNEYRDGLVGFSIGMGMFVKFWVILASLFLLCCLLIIELGIFLGFLIWPVFTVYLLFI
ncbi:MAG TPA: hypothetical protein VF189_01940 [Patescibacteria group bacterium]